MAPGDEPRRQELAAFLKARRAELTPQMVGLPTMGRRRTPGLRREEVAHLSGLGATWYTWLKQGRNIPASEQVVDALGGALRLDEANRRHLRALANLPLTDTSSAPELPLTRLSRLVERLHPTPSDSGLCHRHPLRLPGLERRLRCGVPRPRRRRTTSPQPCLALLHRPRHPRPDRRLGATRPKASRAAARYRGPPPRRPAAHRTGQRPERAQPRIPHLMDALPSC